MIDHKRTADLRRRIQEERYHLALYRSSKGAVVDGDAPTEADRPPPRVVATSAIAPASPLKRRVDEAYLTQETTAALPKKRSRLSDSPLADAPVPARETDIEAASTTHQRPVSRLVMRVRVNEDGFECEHNPVNPPHPQEKNDDQPHPSSANAKDDEWTAHLDTYPASSMGRHVVDPALPAQPSPRTLHSPRRRSPPRDQRGGVEDTDDSEHVASESRPSLQRRQPPLGSNKPQGPKNQAFRPSRRGRPGGASSTAGARQSKVIVPVVFSDSSESENEDDKHDAPKLPENHQEKPPPDPPSSSRSSTIAIQDPAAGAPASRRRLNHSPRLANHDALEYVERMRNKHRVSPKKIEQFVLHLKAFKNQQLTASEIAAKISTLLKVGHIQAIRSPHPQKQIYSILAQDYPDLVEDFTKFLPLGDNPDEADSSASLADGVSAHLHDS